MFRHYQDEYTKEKLDALDRAAITVFAGDHGREFVLTTRREEALATRVLAFVESIEADRT